MRTVEVEVPREAHHVPLAIVEHEGYQWLVTEVDRAAGIAVLSRQEVEPPMPREVRPAPRVIQEGGWLVAASAVVIFLILLAENNTRVTFADAVGCVVGFLILLAMYRRGHI